METLADDPVYGSSDGSSNVAPSHYPKGSGHEEPLQMDFRGIKLEPMAGNIFTAFVYAWLVGFECALDEEGKPLVEQPDRLTLLKGIGSGRWPLPILRWLAEYGSVQRAIYEVLRKDESFDGITTALDTSERLSANIAQVAHAAFPDILAFYDHSSKWRRELES